MEVVFIVVAVVMGMVTVAGIGVIASMMYFSPTARLRARVERVVRRYRDDVPDVDVHISNLGGPSAFWNKGKKILVWDPDPLAVFNLIPEVMEYVVLHELGHFYFHHDTLRENTQLEREEQAWSFVVLKKDDVFLADLTEWDRFNRVREYFMNTYR
jgi:beta-lactamase regulating signal transducer with metallopeptidase domain